LNSLVVAALLGWPASAAEIPAADLVRIQQAAPAAPHAKPLQTRRLLVFTLAVDYVHESTPWGVAALRVLGEKTGAYATVASDAPEVFERASLDRFDAVCFLNTCFTPFTNAVLRQNLMSFVREGKGYVGIHCSAHTFLDWAEFGELQGAYSVNHPWHERVTVAIEEPEHSLMRCFGGSTFSLTDEIYQFDQRYSRQRLRVLASLDTQRTDMNKRDILREDGDFGLVWAQSFGRGRAFYSAFGHDPEVYWNPTVLQHYLAGIQFALGDLAADTTPNARLPGYQPRTNVLRKAAYRKVEPSEPTNVWRLPDLGFSGRPEEAVNAGNLGLADEATVALWMKTPEPGNDRRLLSPASGPAEQYGSLRLDAGQMQVWTPTGWQPLIASGLGSNRWAHLAVVFTSDGLATGYLNGRRRYSVPVKLHFAAADVLVGGQFLSRWGNPYLGELRGFQIHQKPLLATEILQLKDNTAPPGLMATPGDPSDLWRELKNYDFTNSRAVLADVEEQVREALTNADAQLELEMRFVDMLDAPDTQLPAKEFICDQLRWIGSDRSVPAVAKLLTHERLSDSARRALQSHPSSKAGAALREALPAASGRVLLGLINSLSIRQDPQALGAFDRLSHHDDPIIATAAIAGMGRIGGAQADKSLADLWRQTHSAQQRARLAEAWLEVADRFLAQGDSEKARIIYRTIFEDSGPDAAARQAASIGLLNTDKGEAFERLIQFLSGTEPALRDVAARYVRSLPATDLERFGPRFSGLPLVAQVQLAYALADRPESSATALLLQGTTSEHSAVRLAAIGALAHQIGTMESAGRLLELAATLTGAEQSAARESLVRLRGISTDTLLLTQLQTGSVARRVEAIQAVGRRGVVGAVPLLLAGSRDPTTAVRLASIRALGHVAESADYSALVELLSAAETTEEREETVRALELAAARIHPLDPCLQILSAKLQQGIPVETRMALLSVLSTMGGPVALTAVQRSVHQPDPDLQLHAVRALANWPDDAAIAGLRAAIPALTNATCRAVAVRGFIRLTGLPGERSDGERVADYEQAWSWSASLDDKRLIVAGLAEVPHPAALAFLESCAREPGLTTEVDLALAKSRKALSRPGAKP
jgi:type 1 glutamine amidotransferase/HEAT repeat protein